MTQDSRIKTFFLWKRRHLAGRFSPNITPSLISPIFNFRSAQRQQMKCHCGCVGFMLPWNWVNPRLSFSYVFICWLFKFRMMVFLSDTVRSWQASAHTDEGQCWTAESKKWLLTLFSSFQQNPQITCTEQLNSLHLLRLTNVLGHSEELAGGGSVWYIMRQNKYF